MIRGRKCSPPQSLARLRESASTVPPRCSTESFADIQRPSPVKEGPLVFLVLDLARVQATLWISQNTALFENVLAFTARKFSRIQDQVLNAFASDTINLQSLCTRASYPTKTIHLGIYGVSNAPTWEIQGRCVQ